MRPDRLKGLPGLQQDADDCSGTSADASSDSVELSAIAWALPWVVSVWGMQTCGGRIAVNIHFDCTAAGGSVFWEWKRGWHEILHRVAIGFRQILGELSVVAAVAGAGRRLAVGKCHGLCQVAQWLSAWQARGCGRGK